MTNYDDDPMADLMAAYDYKVEAYGDRCPGCGTLRWGADCPVCMKGEDEMEEPIVWTVNPKHPERPDAKVPVYGARWIDAKGRKSSNGWPTKAKAEAVVRQLRARGLTVEATTVSYVGGWAF